MDVRWNRAKMSKWNRCLMVPSSWSFTKPRRKIKEIIEFRLPTWPDLWVPRHPWLSTVSFIFRLMVNQDLQFCGFIYSCGWDGNSTNADGSSAIYWAAARMQSQRRRCCHSRGNSFFFSFFCTVIKFFLVRRGRYSSTESRVVQGQ